MGKKKILQMVVEALERKEEEKCLRAKKAMEAEKKKKAMAATKAMKAEEKKKAMEAKKAAKEAKKMMTNKAMKAVDAMIAMKAIRGGGRKWVDRLKRQMVKEANDPWKACHAASSLSHGEIVSL